MKSPKIKRGNKHGSFLTTVPRTQKSESVNAKKKQNAGQSVAVTEAVLLVPDWHLKQLRCHSQSLPGNINEFAGSDLILGKASTGSSPLLNDHHEKQSRRSPQTLQMKK